jgi:hypothetical protein
VIPAKLAGGGVLETTRRFHDASPAFMRPARRPTRGSGLGAAVDIAMSPGAMEPFALAEEVADAHAPAAASVRASDSLSNDEVWGIRIVTKGVVTAR